LTGELLDESNGQLWSMIPDDVFLRFYLFFGSLRCGELSVQFLASRLLGSGVVFRDAFGTYYGFSSSLLPLAPIALSLISL
jgi:hypothetical protein